LFITPTATELSEVALEKFERPIETEFVDPAVQVLNAPSADELIAAATLNGPKAVAYKADAVLDLPMAVDPVPLAVLLRPIAIAYTDEAVFNEPAANAPVPPLAVLLLPTAHEYTAEAVFKIPTATASFALAKFLKPTEVHRRP
jgi:hypothetical protein